MRMTHQIQGAYHTTLGIYGENENSGFTTEKRTYDAFNQLTKVTGNGTTLGIYTYLPNGLRLSKTVNGSTKYFLWDGDQIYAELNSNNAVTAQYLYGTERICNTINNNYYMYNNHGDVSDLTDANGNVIRNYNFFGSDAFGDEKNPDSNDTNPFRYCGEYYDTETGNIYLRARYYDPGIGGFITEDPVRDGVNWYSYCGGNPVMFFDTYGLEKIFASGGAYTEKKGKKDYNYEFIDSALKAAFDASYTANGEKVTICLSTAGFTTEELEGIKKSVDAYGINLEMFENIDDLIGYINNRTDDKITTFEFFSHGSPGNVSFGMYTDRETSLVLDETQINKINSSAFSNCVSKFYSCRAGNDTEESDYILAQHWANATGSMVLAPQGINIAGRIDENTGRTDYSKIHARPYNIFYLDNYIERKLKEINKGSTPAIASPTITDGGHWQIFMPQ